MAMLQMAESATPDAGNVKPEPTPLDGPPEIVHLAPTYLEYLVESFLAPRDGMNFYTHCRHHHHQPFHRDCTLIRVRPRDRLEMTPVVVVVQTTRLLHARRHLSHPILPLPLLLAASERPFIVHRAQTTTQRVLFGNPGCGRVKLTYSH
jgi:hypothetical protein